MTFENLGFQNNIDVLRQLVDLRDKTVVDVGCGAMDFSQVLVTLGARVIAIDPDPVQAEKNRQLGPLEMIEFHESGAESIPAANGSLDGVFFSYSLHHIPETLYPASF